MTVNIQNFYYVLAGIAAVLVFVRVVFGWFRDYDNAQRFTTDMAKIHLPYIFNCLQRIGNKLDLDLDSPPTVNFSYKEKDSHQA